MKKILLVDYDQSSLASLHGILAKEGYLVITAADGQAGWDKYNKESPDLVLMEAMLPKVHGFELCQRITSERNSQAPVFIMTGVYKDRVYRTEALRTYGASEYFEKPLKMAELLASIEAVLGKPEVRPEFKPVEMKPLREIKPEPLPVAPRRREKPKSDDDGFSLPADLDRLSREIPKMRKPGPARRETPAEASLESLADELLKTVVVDSTPHKTGEEKPRGGNGNGHENVDIDKFLKSALAGFDLDKDKVKVPKTAPLAPPPPLKKPNPTPPPTVAFKPMSMPPPPPVVEKPAEPVPLNTLTPGDPGSDSSPFFTPEKAKPEVPAEKPKVQAPPAPPVTYIPAPKPFKAAEKAEKKPEPVKHEPKVREAEARPSADLFKDLGEAKAKKGFPPLVAVGVGVAVVAVIGFFILRPKPAAPVDDGLKAPQTMTQANVPAEPVEELPPPEVKPEPVKQKAEPQAKPADPGPTAEAIILPVAPSAAPPLIGSQSAGGSGNSQGGAESKPAQADSPPVKTEETGTAAESGTAADPGTAAAAPAPAVPQVNEGDLVDLGSVTELPKLLKTVDPVYPQMAQRIGVEGMITVNALIDEKGDVIDTGILKGIQDDKGLGRAAETAVKKWKFQPARKNGVAVKVWKSFVISFKADKNSANVME